MKKKVLWHRRQAKTNYSGTVGRLADTETENTCGNARPNRDGTFRADFLTAEARDTLFLVDYHPGLGRGRVFANHYRVGSTNLRALATGCALGLVDFGLERDEAVEHSGQALRTGQMVGGTRPGHTPRRFWFQFIYAVPNYLNIVDFPN